MARPALGRTRWGVATLVTALGWTSVAAPPASGRELILRDPGSASVDGTPAPSPAGATACAAGPESLCLGDGRFEVRVDWRDPRTGDEGVGRVFDGLGTALSGYFWFFRDDNLELAVKVLDAREIDGHFWILWGGLSDVGYTIRVTDTESGVVHDFQNPPLTLCGGAVTHRL